MLNVFSELAPFFEDNYRRINIREYARTAQMSPPTASNELSRLEKEGLLNKEIDRKYIFYFAKRENKLFVLLSRAYWMKKLEKIGLIDELEKKLVMPVIILFGSFSKAEITERSDIDIAIFSPSGNYPDLSKFEKKMKRKIQIFMFKDRSKVNNDKLLNNILNGQIISGGW